MKKPITIKEQKVIDRRRRRPTTVGFIAHWEHRVEASQSAISIQIKGKGITGVKAMVNLKQAAECAKVLLIDIINSEPKMRL